MNKRLQTARRELSRLEWEREREMVPAALLQLDRDIRDVRWSVEDLELAEREIAVTQARRTARVLDGGLWFDAVLVMLFSLGNIHQFALNHGTPNPIAWTPAPMVDVALVVALAADAFLSRNGTETESNWPTVLRWFAGLATLVLNTWASWVSLDAPAIVLHTVPPVLLLVLAEAAPRYRRASVLVVAATEARIRSTRATADPDQAVALPEPVAAAPARNAADENTGVNGVYLDPADVPAPETVTTAVPVPVAQDDTMAVATATGATRKRPVPPPRITSATGATSATRSTVKQVPGAGRVARPVKSDEQVLEELAVLRLTAEDVLPVRQVCQSIGIGQRRLESLMEREGLSLEPLAPVAPGLHLVESAADQDDLLTAAGGE